MQMTMIQPWITQPWTLPPIKTTIRNDLDIVTARTTARDVAHSLGFGPIDQSRIATAVSEMARNIFLHAGVGDVIVRNIENDGRVGIEIEFQDQGPGITDINQLMQDRTSSRCTTGKGFSIAKRLMDEFYIQSKAGSGTRIVCRKWRV